MHARNANCQGLPRRRIRHPPDSDRFPRGLWENPGPGRPGRPGPPWLAAGRAETQDVEAMAMGLEALGAGEVADGAGDAVLDAGGQGDVGDFPAADADQVVVVPGQVLGEL